MVDFGGHHNTDFGNGSVKRIKAPGWQQGGTERRHKAVRGGRGSRGWRQR